MFPFVLMATFILAIGFGAHLILSEPPTTSLTNKGSLDRFEPIVTSPTLDGVLAQFRSVIGENDFAGYRNHCLRVVNFALLFLPSNVDRRVRDLVEVAVAFHDIALWTDNKLAYLEPSIEQLRLWVKKNAGSGAAGSVVAQLTDGEAKVVEDMIFFHHKVTPFVASTNSLPLFPGGVSHADLVNAVRRGDWVDASLGLLGKGLPVDVVQKVQAALPNAGFHQTLGEFLAFRVRGWAQLPISAWELTTALMKW